jgi:membrane-associated protease RseP (regulator of RpoE activity)
MDHFSRLVFKASSITALSSVTILMGSTAFAPAIFAAQLLGVVPDSPALLLHSSQGYLGIEMRDVDNDRASSLKLKDASGAEVTYVDHDAPAGKVGLRVHDVILQMNGQQVQGVEQLRRMLHETPAGRAVVLLISRDGQQQTINVQLGDRAKIEQDAWSQHLTVLDPDNDSSFAPVGPTGHGVGGGGSFFGSLTLGTPSVGVELDTLGSQLADYFGVRDGQGLLVKHVAENSPASTAGFKAGDVITKVNGESMATLNTWLKTLHANRGKQMQVTIVRNHKEQTLSLTAGDPKHKGELVWPGIDMGPGVRMIVPDEAEPESDLEIIQPGIDLNLAQLDSQLSRLGSAQQTRKALNEADADALARQAQQIVRSLDMRKLQQELKDQQKQLQEQMLDWDKDMQAIQIRPLD